MPALVALAIAAGACAAAPQERSLLEAFFRAARLHDTTALAAIATTTYNPRTEGTVQSFEIVSAEPERNGRKRVMVEARVRTPEGRVVPRTLVVTLEARDGRWLITGIAARATSG